MSTIEKIGSALQYDAIESILATGGSLALAYSFAVAALPEYTADDSAPESAPTVLATVMG